MSETVDLISEIAESIKNRISSPILGTLFISFFLYNWKIPLILLDSNFTSLEKINLINEKHFNSLQSKASTYGYPLLITIFILIAIPLIKEFYSIYLSQISEREFQREAERLQNVEDIKTYRTMVIESLALVQTDLDVIKKEKELLTKEVDENFLSQFHSLFSHIDFLYEDLENFKNSSIVKKHKSLHDYVNNLEKRKFRELGKDINKLGREGFKIIKSLANFGMNSRKTEKE